MPGLPELLVILLIVLLIFGAGKLPAIGDALGRSIKNFRRSASGKNEIEVSEKKSLSAGKKVKELAEGDDEDEDDDIEEADVVESKKRKAVAEQ